MTDAEARRRSFGAVAELYDRRRPSYPPPIVDAVLSGVASGATVVESGCGTGIASALFLERGMRVIGVDPSEEMTAVARRRGVEVVVSGFEDADRPAASADVVAAAQSWHWVRQPAGCEAARRLLRTGGRLAVFWNSARPDETPLRAEMNRVYERWAPGLAQTSVVTTWTGEADRYRGDIVASGLFDEPAQTALDWQCAYTTEEYVELLQTHSDHIVLPAGQRASLLAAVADVVGAAGGTVVLPYRTTLITATPLP